MSMLSQGCPATARVLKHLIEPHGEVGRCEEGLCLRPEGRQFDLQCSVAWARLRLPCQPTCKECISLAPTPGSDRLFLG
jgi:hypothetical protein